MNENRSNLSQEEVEELTSIYKISESHIQSLYTKFNKVSKNGSGMLSLDILRNCPELAANPLLGRVSSILSTSDNAIDFRGFMEILGTILETDCTERKLKYVFRLFDIDCDGIIGNGEMFQVLKLMLGNKLNNVQIQQIVDKAMLYGDKDEDGAISFDEFKKMITKMENLQKQMRAAYPRDNSSRQSHDNCGPSNDP